MIKSNYKLPDQTIPGISFSDHLADISAFQRMLNGFGLRTQNTRIERYQRYLEAIVNRDKKAESQIFRGLENYEFDNEQDRQLYVLREVHELMWILRGLNSHIPRGIEKNLKQVIGGRDFAVLDVNSASRNAQFELRIASYFCQADHQVDISTDTDILACRSKDVFFVECKRVSSENLFSRRVSEARKQLYRRMPRDTMKKRHYGVVVVDVTKLAFTHNGLTLGYTSEHTKDVIQDKLIEISKKVDNASCFDKKSNVLLLWLQIHIPALVIHPNMLMTRFSSYFIVNPRLSGKNLKAFRRLQNVLHVNTSDSREIPSEKLTIRKGITLPAGTTMDWDEDLLSDLFDSSELVYREPEHTVLALNFDNSEHIFSYFDFEALYLGLDKNEKMELQKDHIRARLELAARLFISRFPYEEPQ